MKTGLSLTELATEIERRANAKRDMVVSTENLRMEVADQPAHAEAGVTGNALVVANRETYGANTVAHRQIAEYADIPAKYYDRMRMEAPRLLADNVNTWFAKKPAPRMVRTLDGTARAFLSDRYRPLENEELAEAVLPALLDLDVEIMSAQITETRLYIKAVHRSIRKDMPVEAKGAGWGDGSHHIFRTQSPGIVISNSEVGYGALSVETSVFDRVCTNLAIFSQHSMKKYHTGAKQGLLTDDIMHLLSDETRRLTDKAVWAQVGDIVRGAFDEAKFNARVDEIAGLQDVKLEGDPVKVVELAARRFGLNQGEQTSILRHLIEGAALTGYGLYNAVTRTGQDQDDYDRATTFEKLGGKLLDLAKEDWRELAKAA